MFSKKELESHPGQGPCLLPFVTLPVWPSLLQMVSPISQPETLKFEVTEYHTSEVFAPNLQNVT